MKRLLAVAVCWLIAGVVVSGEPLTNRPAAWARPIAMAGVPNLHQVSTNFYRSAQPAAEGMLNLKKKGVVTIVNLRAFHSDRDEIGNTGLVSESIPMKTWHPEREDVIRFLRIVTDPKHAPVLVHCQHGADRTGTMCAIYRVAVQGWTKDEAIREMTEGGFGFHEVWKNLPSWIERLDIKSIRKEVGIDAGTEDGTANRAQPARSETNPPPVAAHLEAIRAALVSGTEATNLTDVEVTRLMNESIRTNLAAQLWFRNWLGGTLSAEAVKMSDELKVLESLRAGRTNDAIRELEDALDRDIIALAFQFRVADKSEFKWTSQSLTALQWAKEYRLKFPRKTGDPAIDEHVEDGLSYLDQK